MTEIIRKQVRIILALASCLERPWVRGRMAFTINAISHRRVVVLSFKFERLLIIGKFEWKLYAFENADREQFRNHVQA